MAFATRASLSLSRAAVAAPKAGSRRAAPVACAPDETVEATTSEVRRAAPPPRRPPRRPHAAPYGAFARDAGCCERGWAPLPPLAAPLTRAPVSACVRNTRTTTATPPFNACRCRG